VSIDQPEPIAEICRPQIVAATREGGGEAEGQEAVPRPQLEEIAMKTKWIIAITLIALLTAVAGPIRVNGQKAADTQPLHSRYKLIDLGTFGGPASYLESPTPAVEVLNNRRMVTGEADTTIPDPLCFNRSCFVGHAFVWYDGILTDLGALPGVNSSLGYWINSSGAVVGYSENGVTDPLIGGPEVRAVLWTQGKIKDLGTLGGNESYAVGVNSLGQVTGVAANGIADPFSLLFGTQTRAFLWQEGVMLDLGTLGGPDAVAQIINDSGQITGYAYTNFTPNSTTGIPTVDPFLWKNGTMVDLGTLGGAFGFSNDVNERGQVVGQSDLAGDLVNHPFFWDHGVLTDLGTLGGDNGEATALNDAGQVIGSADLPGSQAHHAFLWEHGKMTDLGTVDGDPCSNESAINSRGQIVGTTVNCEGVPLHAFLWENGGPMVDLQSLVLSGSSLTLLIAGDINDLGEIVGKGLPPGCGNYHTCGHDVLLIPCDENHPNVEGCDYSLVSAGSEVVPAHANYIPAATAASKKQWSASEIIAQYSSFAHRRFGALPPE
jgi:probable HAF family extracellular repeat protein